MTWGTYLLLDGFVEDLHGLAGVLLMLLEVVVGAAGDAPEFLFAMGEVEHEVGGGPRVKGEFVLRVDVFGDGLAGQTDGDEPVSTGVEPLAVEGSASRHRVR